MQTREEAAAQENRRIHTLIASGVIMSAFMLAYPVASLAHSFNGAADTSSHVTSQEEVYNQKAYYMLKDAGYNPNHITLTKSIPKNAENILEGLTMKFNVMAPGTLDEVTRVVTCRPAQIQSPVSMNCSISPV